MGAERPEPDPGTAPAVPVQTAILELRADFQGGGHRHCLCFHLLENWIFIFVNTRHSKIQNGPPFLDISPKLTTRHGFKLVFGCIRTS